MAETWIAQGRRARRETAQIDFKAEFNKRAWPEVIKDVVAMANSGGGAVVFGVLDSGRTSQADLGAADAIDPAQLVDQIHKYTSSSFGDVVVASVRRQGGARAVIFGVGAAEFPLVFEKEGAYEPEPGKQRKVCFWPGMIYVRRGAKSTPATNEDLRSMFDRKLNDVRHDWLEGIAKVVETPADAELRAVRFSGEEGDLRVQLVDDPTAPVFGQLHPDRTHPHRQKELVAVVNKGLRDINERLRTKRRSINGYDVQRVRRVYGIDDRPDFFWKPRFGSPQYSDAFAEWLLERFAEDRRFFTRARRGEVSPSVA